MPIFKLIKLAIMFFAFLCNTFILSWILIEASLAKTIGGDHKKDAVFFSFFCAYFVPR